MDLTIKQDNIVETFEGFKWTIPKGFRTAISECIFLEGDRIYSNADGYSNTPKCNYKIIRVTKPSRYIEIEDKEKSKKKSLFKKNWKMPVEFEELSLNNNEIKRIYSTQGGLFTYLWKNNLLIDPDIPNTLIDVRKLLPKLSNHPKLNLSGNESISFSIPYDETNNVCVEKYHRINSILYDRYRINLKQKKFMINALFPDLENYIPTASVFVFNIKTKDINALSLAIKEALKSKNEKKPVALKRHGVFSIFK